MDQPEAINGRWFESLTRDGFAVIEGVVSTQSVAELTDLINGYLAGTGSGILARRGETYGIRDLLWRAPEIQRLAQSPELTQIVRAAVGPKAFAVRALYFDKTPATS